MINEYLNDEKKYENDRIRNGTKRKSNFQRAGGMEWATEWKRKWEFFD